MSKFIVALTDNEIARQIAELLNANNNLYIVHSETSVLKNAINYYIEIVGNVVIGCVGVEHTPLTTRLRHICIKPEYRQNGIAKRLLKRAINDNQSVEYIMTIRLDNVASLRMAGSMGFQPNGNYLNKEHHVIIMRRINGQLKR